MAFGKEDLENIERRLSELNEELTGCFNELEEVRLEVREALENWPTPEPQPRRIMSTRHKYDNSTPVDLGAHDFYDLQRGWTEKPSDPGSPQTNPPEIFIYATIVKRPGDEEGKTQFLRPDSVREEWLVRDWQGNVVTRSHGTQQMDYMVNFGHADWQEAAIRNIVFECERHNATGLYLDEVDYWYKYAWPSLAGTGSKAFPTEVAWRTQWLGFIRALGNKLEQHRLKLWINLGADYNLENSWQEQLVSMVDAVNIEFYTGRERVGAAPTSINDAWGSQNKFVSEVEKTFGIPVHVHCSSLNQSVVDYAFLSWLLSTEFLGSFCASLEYGDDYRNPSLALASAALALGAPNGDMVATGNGTYMRSFKNGAVYVNPTRSRINDLVALSGRIWLP